MADASQSNRLVLPPALGCFVWLAKARPPMKGAENPRSLYQMVLIWKKSDREKLAALAAAIKEKATEAFGANPKGKIRMPIRDGDTERPGYKEFADSFFVTVSSERRPQVVNSRREPILPDDMEDEAYSGCTFRVSVSLYAYDAKGNRGIGIGLRNVQVAAKGPHLDGGVSAEEEFKEFGDAAPTASVDDIL